MPRKKKTNNIETQTDELDDEVIEKTDEIKFHCPVCQHILEVQNEMVIKKKCDCSCKCVTFAFKISKNDKSLTIENTENGDITLESDIHNIQFRWGKQITPSENDNETLRSIMSNN